MKNESAKVWFVTGTSSGFGRSLVEEVVARGDRVIATARDPESVADLVASAPDRVHALRLDVTSPDQVAEATRAAIARFGQVDVVVNNAGFSIVGALEETSDAELRTVFETMYFGPIAVTRAFLPHMRERRKGTIVQMSSVGGLVTMPGFGPYSAVKHALEATSEALAGEVAAHGIRVLLVEPGAFRTRLFGGAFRAMDPTPTYEAVLRPTRAYIADQAGKQAGDPAKAAKAIVDAVEAGAPNLRLPLGADSVEGLRAKLAAVEKDIAATEAVARATAF